MKVRFVHVLMSVIMRTVQELLRMQKEWKTETGRKHKHVPNDTFICMEF